MARALLCLVLLGCASAPKEEQAPCRLADYGILAATCGDDVDICNQKIEERERFCAEKIRSGE